MVFGLFENSGQEAACMLPNAVRYQLRYTPKCVKYSIFAVFP